MSSPTTPRTNTAPPPHSQAEQQQQQRAVEDARARLWFANGASLKNVEKMSRGHTTLSIGRRMLESYSHFALRRPLSGEIEASSGSLEQKNRYHVIIDRICGRLSNSKLEAGYGVDPPFVESLGDPIQLCSFLKNMRSTLGPAVPLFKITGMETVGHKWVLSQFVATSARRTSTLVWLPASMLVSALKRLGGPLAARELADYHAQLDAYTQQQRAELLRGSMEHSLLKQRVAVAGLTATESSAALEQTAAAAVFNEVFNKLCHSHTFFRSRLIAARTHTDTLLIRTIGPFF
jgi:hypothetical protein